jgi:hypothetical protein
MPTSTGTIYTVPSDGSASSVVLSSVLVSNNRTDSTSVVYHLYVVPSGATLAVTTHAIAAFRSLTPGDLPDLLELGIPLVPGDTVQGVASQSGCGIILSGVVDA